eukprot:gene4244-5313_t
MEIDNNTNALNSNSIDDASQSSLAQQPIINSDLEQKIKELNEKLEREIKENNVLKKQLQELSPNKTNVVGASSGESNNKSTTGSPPISPVLRDNHKQIEETISKFEEQVMQLKICLTKRTPSSSTLPKPILSTSINNLNTQQQQQQQQQITKETLLESQKLLQSKVTTFEEKFNSIKSILLDISSINSAPPMDLDEQSTSTTNDTNNGTNNDTNNNTTTTSVSNVINTSNNTISSGSSTPEFEDQQQQQQKSNEPSSNVTIIDVQPPVNNNNNTNNNNNNTAKSIETNVSTESVQSLQENNTQSSTITTITESPSSNNELPPSSINNESTTKNVQLKEEESNDKNNESKETTTNSKDESKEEEKKEIEKPIENNSSTNTISTQTNNTTNTNAVVLEQNLTPKINKKEPLSNNSSKGSIADDLISLPDPPSTLPILNHNNSNTAPSSSISSSSSQTSNGTKSEDTIKEVALTDIIIKEGYLKKKGGGEGGRRNWTTRWFKLKADSLSYHKKRKDSKPKGVIKLTQARVETHSGKPFGIVILSGVNNKNLVRDYLLMADTKKEQDEWIQILSENISKLHLNSQTSPNLTSSNLVPKK